MRSIFVGAVAFAASASAHTIFQRLSVNGADQGFLTGVRSPANDNPIYDPTQADIACNTGLHNPVSSAVVNVNAGDKLGALWQHILGGPQGANDPDNPIASSHKGPIMAYMAKVDSAATNSGAGLQWFKIFEDDLDNTTGQWGVDHMIANQGWSYFTLPSCIAAGQYLLRVELLALHSAYAEGGSQFYLSCANINVASGGSLTSPATVSFPGAYSQTDPSILINIYGPSGNPDNGGKPYTAPGPRPITCPAGSGSSSSAAPTTLTTVRPSSATGITTAVPTSTGAAGAGVALYGQCGGTGYTGATTCAQGTCKVVNPYYSQCLS